MTLADQLFIRDVLIGAVVYVVVMYGILSWLFRSKP